ncbi:sigma-54 dependent transcriptional regulator [Candidatus Albibeggiatoa sp. nov. BB20]|uniref:sigma-54-dependent transcriptional regulator n=1 Tax=Candidatus Albibeggiatoa sp. nov. BB20 TaxID=3162723 RepID=UPI00336554A1
MPKESLPEEDQSTPSEEARSLRILIVDDDEVILVMVSAWLAEVGYEVKTCNTGESAMELLPEFRPHLVITDLRMDDMDGITLLKEIQQFNSVLPVIMLSGTADISDAVRATHQGIFEFLTKSDDLPEKLLHCVTSALNHVGASDASENSFAPEIIHRSTLMANLLNQAKRVARARSSVFIGGETGTGKELLANAIHRSSPRANEMFLAVNCGALSEQLLESELFGHEKGAFTGAVRKNLGLFQAAHGGTLFLDEVGDMPASLQVKLLRVLQEGQVKPVGAINGVPIDVRIISATHRDLEMEVKRGEFREDLFYRLNVIPLYMPSLKERGEDIPLLLDHFLNLHSEQDGESLRFSPEALDYMASLPWPGNVRQLQNVVEQCSVLSPSPMIPLSLIKQALRQSENKFQTLAQAQKEFDRNYLLRVMNMVAGNEEQAANVTGCELAELTELLKTHNINPARFRKVVEEDAAEEDSIHTV